MQVVSDAEYQKSIDRIIQYNHLYTRYKKLKRLLYLQDEIENLERKIRLLKRCSSKIEENMKDLKKKSLSKRLKLNIPLKETDDNVREEIYQLCKSTRNELKHF